MNVPKMIHEEQPTTSRADSSVTREQPVTTRFRPAQRGFRFGNRFPGDPTPWPWLHLPGEAQRIYGLCGGMCATAYDLLLAGRPIPPLTEPPPKNSPLYRYIFWRQWQTLGTLWLYTLKFFHWMWLPDEGPRGTWRRTYQALPIIAARLGAGQLVPLGLVYVSHKETWILWRNHQVLAYGLTASGPEQLDLHIYDPNFEQQDDVVIHAERVVVQPGPAPVYGYRCVERVGTTTEFKVRGVFPMPYRRRVPPAF